MQGFFKELFGFTHDEELLGSFLPEDDFDFFFCHLSLFETLSVLGWRDWYYYCVYVVFSRLSDCLHVERVKTDGDRGEVLLDLSPHRRPGVTRGVPCGVSLPDHGVGILEV